MALPEVPLCPPCAPRPRLGVRGAGDRSISRSTWVGNPWGSFFSMIITKTRQGCEFWLSKVSLKHRMWLGKGGALVQESGAGKPPTAKAEAQRGTGCSTPLGNQKKKGKGSTRHIWHFKQQPRMIHSLSQHTHWGRKIYWRERCVFQIAPFPRSKSLSLSHISQLMAYKGIPSPRTQGQTHLPLLPLAHHLAPFALKNHFPTGYPHL